MRSLLFIAALGLSSAALAGEEDAEVCVRTKVWDGYSEGWAIRTMTSTTLKSGETRNYLVTLYAGNEYRIQACGDDNVADLDVLLYDLEGNIVARDDADGREPAFTFKPESTRTYYVVLYAQRLKTGASDAGAGLAVTYR